MRCPGRVEPGNDAVHHARRTLSADHVLCPSRTGARESIWGRDRFERTDDGATLVMTKYFKRPDPE